jgi:hypothetical protein
VSVARIVRLWCDHVHPPAEGRRYGRPCPAEFNPDPDLGFVSQFGVMRREAAKAGWAHQRSPLGRPFDKDFCPDHKPEESTE